MNQLAQQTFRPTRRSWNKQLKAWGWLLFFWFLMGGIWWFTKHPIAFLMSIVLLVNTIPLIIRTIAIAQNTLLFYPSHFTMLAGRTRKEVTYSEVEALDRAFAAPTSKEEFFVITLRDRQMFFSAEYYDKEGVWQTFQHYLPSAVLEPTAIEKSSLVQNHTRETIEMVEGQKPFVVQQLGVVGVIAGWLFVAFLGAITFLFAWLGVDWRVSTFFTLITLLFAVAMLRNGHIEVDKDKIAHSTLFGRNEIRWDEIEYVGKNGGNFHFGNTIKRLVLPLPLSQSTNKNLNIMWNYIEITLNERNVPRREIKTLAWWSKNTRVSSSKSNQTT